MSPGRLGRLPAWTPRLCPGGDRKPCSSLRMPTAVRTMACEVLRPPGLCGARSQGTDSMRCASPKRHGGTIELLITDVRHAARERGANWLSGCCRRDSQMKVLFISGYTDHPLVYQGLTARAAPVTEAVYT